MKPLLMIPFFLVLLLLGLTSCRQPTQAELSQPHFVHALGALKAIDDGDKRAFTALLSDRKRTQFGEPSTREVYSDEVAFRDLQKFLSSYDFEDWKLELKQDAAIEFPDFGYEVAYYFKLRPDANEDPILGMTVLQRTPQGGKSTLEIVDLYPLDE